MERLATLPFPVVASVRGHCYTGGLELVLAVAFEAIDQASGSVEAYLADADIDEPRREALARLLTEPA